MVMVAAAAEANMASVEKRVKKLVVLLYLNFELVI